MQGTFDSAQFCVCFVLVCLIRAQWARWSEKELLTACLGVKELKRSLARWVRGLASQRAPWRLKGQQVANFPADQSKTFPPQKKRSFCYISIFFIIHFPLKWVIIIILLRMGMGSFCNMIVYVYDIYMLCVYSLCMHTLVVSFILDIMFQCVLLLFAIWLYRCCGKSLWATWICAI